MRTYSHFIITVAASQGFKNKPGCRRALLLGAVFPDLPLTLLTMVYFVLRKLDKVNHSPTTARHFKDIRCTDPAWVVSYNFFHAPLILAPLLRISYLWGIKRSNRWGEFLFWFTVGCSLHSTIDIVTHHDDGPLVLFPVEWQTRLTGPISYWDKRHGGYVFTVLEHLIDALLVLYLRYHLESQKAKRISRWYLP